MARYSVTPSNHPREQQGGLIGVFKPVIAPVLIDGEHHNPLYLFISTIMEQWSVYFSVWLIVVISGVGFRRV